MVEIVRRKNTKIQAPDVSSSSIAVSQGIQHVNPILVKSGMVLNKFGEEKQKKEDAEYQKNVESNIKSEQKRIADQKKTFDAADKLIAADMAGRLENDLLRWNLDQRTNNPTLIGTPDHERAMREEYSRLSSQYGKGLGEVGTAVFQEKTQGKVNDFISNDIKWAYQQKLKQGEESARATAKTMEETAGVYGSAGDVAGFKQAHAENRQLLDDYIQKTAPIGAPAALYEADRNSLTKFYENMAQTNPVKAKAMLDSMDNFRESVPEEMTQGVNDIIRKTQERQIKDNIVMINAGMENTKKGSPQYRELAKQKKKFEKELESINDEDYSEKSVEAIRKEIADSVDPILQKSLGESILKEKKAHEEQKIERFKDFMKLPTNENIKWFEQDNQMSYVKPENNMSPLPEDMKSQKQKSKELLDNMLKYRENFGNVSMKDFSDYSGTKKMFDDLKALAQVDSDKDGNVDNVLLKGLKALNNAKNEEISQEDFNNYEKVINQTMFDRSFKTQINDFIENTKNFMPDNFWDSPRLTGSMRTRINEKMESRTRDVLRHTIAEWSNGSMSEQEITKMYMKGVEKAYNDTINDFFGINMDAIQKQYEQKGVALAKIHGNDYLYKGIDVAGNPIWEPVNFYTGIKAAQMIKKSNMGAM